MAKLTPKQFYALTVVSVFWRRDSDLRETYGIKWPTLRALRDAGQILTSCRDGWGWSMQRPATWELIGSCEKSPSDQLCTRALYVWDSEKLQVLELIPGNSHRMIGAARSLAMARSVVEVATRGARNWRDSC